MDITVVVQPEPSCSDKPQKAYVKPISDHLSPMAMSKVYELSPDCLSTENNIMLVIPLLQKHSYDYRNLTLMYKGDIHDEFVPTYILGDHKPTWLFHGNKCYIFISHFCKMFVKKTSTQHGKIKSFHCEALLFHKQTGNQPELKTTFGCYRKKSHCSSEKVIEVITSL